MLFLAPTQWFNLSLYGSFALSNQSGMITKQTITIIGATGEFGSAISKVLSKGNYRLLLCGLNNDKLLQLQDEIRTINPSADVESAACSVNATWEADMIIIAVPCEEEKIVAERIRHMANQKIVVTIAHPLSISRGNNAISNGIADKELQNLLPNSKVVEAFTDASAADISNLLFDGKQVDILIAGIDNEALQTVSDLVKTAGFNPVNTSSLTGDPTLDEMLSHPKHLERSYDNSLVAG